MTEGVIVDSGGFRTYILAGQQSGRSYYTGAECATTRSKSGPHHHSVLGRALARLPSSAGLGFPFGCAMRGQGRGPSSRRVGAPWVEMGTGRSGRRRGRLRGTDPDRRLTK